MKCNLNKLLKMAGIVMALFIICSVSVYAQTPLSNTGIGKPKAMDIYSEDIPYGTSIGGEIIPGEKRDVPNEFKAIVDDNKYNEPKWFQELEIPGSPIIPTSTPTVAPTPTATVVIPIDEGGIGAHLCVFDDTSDVIVDFAFSSAGYKNEFRLAAPKRIELGWSQGEMPNNRVGTAFGTVWNLGKFPIGQELIFANTANGVTYYTGQASRNPDNVIHAAVSLKNATGTHHKYLVSFEDYWGGGDKDYNDVEFFVSGNVGICSPEHVIDYGDAGSGALVPIYIEGSVCKCSSKYNSGGKSTCVAQFTYNSTVDNLIIPVRSSGLPWNEFTGSGMVEQYRCQPTIFYIDSSQNAPFWTNRFHNNIKWKLGHTQSALVKCQSNTPSCVDSDAVCTDCKSYDGKR